LTARIEITNLSDVLHTLSINATKIEQAAAYGVAQVALAIERETKQLLFTRQNSGRYGGKGGDRYRGHELVKGDGQPPNRVTGALASSVRTELRQGFGTYYADVFPTMVYARALELGNPRWKSGVKYPYLRPAVAKVKPRANQIFVTNFMKKWR
jgi:hypothetical protein